MGKDREHPAQHWQRRLRQDLRVLLHLFPWRVAAALTVGVALSALGYQHAYRHFEVPLGAPPLSYTKAVYAIVNMILFQLSYADMPDSPDLDAFFVLVPLIGVPLFLVFGANIINIIRIFFVRGERDQLWQQALASTVEHPIVVCGLGRIGYRVSSQFLDLERPVVGIEAVPSPLVNALIERDVPVLLGDVRNEEILRQAGVERARVVVVCTDKDLVNIEAAFRIREINPQARIVLRLFEDEIAEEIKRHFEVEAIISRSAIAAQAFAYAAIGLEVLEAFDLESQLYFLAKAPLKNASPLLGRTIQAIEGHCGGTVVCLYREGRLTIEPGPDTAVRCGDTLFVFTPAERLAAMTGNSASQSDAGAGTAAPIIVCGLRHTGYRVVNALLAQKRQVIALDFERGRLSKRLQESGVAVRYGDFRQNSILEQAGVQQAEALVACTEDDMINFETALRAREVNPNVRVVIRIFEEALGERLQQAFNIDAVYSTSSIAAPAFVSAALKIHLAQPVNVGGEQFFIARLVIETLSGLHRESIDALTRESDLTILLHKRDKDIHVPPRTGEVLKPGDEIVVLASQKKLRDLSLRNRAARDLR